MKFITKTIGLLAVAWAAAQVPALAQNPEKLAIIPGNHTYPVAINHAGEIIGVTYHAAWTQVTAVHWVNGELSTLPGYRSSVAYGINDNGTIVGAEFDNPSLAPEPVIWVNGQPTLLPTLGLGGVAYDINAAGDIVGWVNGASMTVPAVWRNGQLTVLTTLEDNGGEARSIDSRGVITGFSRSADYFSQIPTQWSSDVATGLPVNFDDNYAGVLGITKSNGGASAGYLVQKETLEDGSFYYINLAVAWKDGQYLVLQRPSGRGNSVAYGVNNQGVIFGYTTSVEGYKTPTLWDQDGAVRLPIEEGRSASAVGANDQGVVVGVDDTNPHDAQPVLWRLDQLNRIQMTSVQTDAGKTVTIQAAVRRSNAPVIGRMVEFRVGNKRVGLLKTNSIGVASLTYKVPARSSRRVDIMASLGGSNYIFRNLVSGRSATVAAVTPSRIKPGKSAKIAASISSLETNRPLANADVTLWVAGKSVAKGRTTPNGTVRFDYQAAKSLQASKLNIEVRYAGDTRNLPAAAKATIFVKN